MTSSTTPCAEGAFPPFNTPGHPAQPAPAASAVPLRMQVWPVTHDHRHGTDVYLFDHLPTDAEVIDRINAVSSWEPQDGEAFDILPPETFDVGGAQGNALAGVHEVNLAELFDYVTPDELWDWRWLVYVATFRHTGKGGGRDALDLMVNVKTAFSDVGHVPAALRPVFIEAIARGATWVLVHSG